MLYRLTDNNGWLVCEPGSRAKMVAAAKRLDADFGPVWLEGYDPDGTLNWSMRLDREGFAALSRK